MGIVTPCANGQPPTTSVNPHGRCGKSLFTASVRRWTGVRLFVVEDASEEVVDGTIPDGFAVPLIEEFAQAANNFFPFLIL